MIDFIIYAVLLSLGVFIFLIWIGSIWAARRSLGKGDPLGKASLHAFLGWLYLIYEGMNARGVPEKKGWKRNLLAFFLGGIAVLSMILIFQIANFILEMMLKDALYSLIFGYD